MAAQYQIKIGYFESPSKFYFTPFHRDSEAQLKLTKLESELSHYCATNSAEAKESSLHKGKIVAFFNTRWSKWTRGEIVSVPAEGSSSYKIHMIDYSHCKSLSDITFMELPDKFKVPSPTVRIGSLGLQPCEPSRDRQSHEKVVKWSESVYEFLKIFGEYNDSRHYFLETLRIDGNTHVGDVFAISKNQTELNIGENLIKKGLAQRDSSVRKVQKARKPKALFEVPSTNFQEIFDALMPSDEFQKKPKPLIFLPAGINLGDYERQRVKASKIQAIMKETVQEMQSPMTEVETVSKAAEKEVAEVVEVVRVNPTSDVINHLGTELIAQPECIDVVKIITDKQKCSRNVPVCNNIWLFGECKKDDCINRHIFTDDDKSSLGLPIPSCITFELMSVESPSAFIIKVKSYLEGAKFVSNKKLEESEKLIEELQEFYSNAEYHKVGKIAEGEMCAINEGTKWQRCRIVEMPSQTTVKVYLIDVGTIFTTAASKLFDLPNHFKSIAPLVCKLQLISLVPFNNEGNWANDHKEKVVKMLEKFVTEGYTFMCKVPIGIQDILFTESFDVKDENDGSIKLRYKGKALKENICKVDVSVEVKLRKLTVAVN